ncbi:PREDICTED: transmembrane protein 134-like isoform X2 [Acropora digitifera]|uniref:transmembrane protein 134-like isoform X2 n=1 Tax=Acropora digitifera TaxID=70779 RepID=UPI00077AE9D9|nr:PREDICTED: transmembrane protein 134-like isoform X2 [Acropora digitifera]
MASMPQHGVNNEILVSESDDEDGDEVSDIATRTRPSYKKNTKSPVPRPVEPKVFVQNEQEAFSRSGEFQRSSSSFHDGENSEPRRKPEYFGTNSLEFESQEDVTSRWKRETLFWLRHPRIRENWKTVTAAFLLFVAGIAFLLAGIVLAATADDGMKSIIFFVCAVICILPGGYHIIYIYRATKGQRGYNFESIPSFQ